MLTFKFKTTNTGQKKLLTNVTGKTILESSKLNKGTAFTTEERATFGLLGKLPHQYESLEQQANRHYKQFCLFQTDLERNIFLSALHNTNETLFYKLVTDHLELMMPVIYTPTVGEAVEKFSINFRRQRGLYITYPDVEHIGEMLQNRLNADIDLIVVTDGSAVLGIGDQGIGGMAISIGKLMVYTLCGGINPNRVLPIQLDVGTNNERLLNDPMYLGWRHNRIEGKEYDAFIDRFVKAVQKQFPNVYLHWEDIERQNAGKILAKYRNDMCTFNDDMQGTGAITLATLLSALNRTQQSLKDQQVVVFGAGTAAVGICDQLVDALVHEGMDRLEAYRKFWLINRGGLLTAGRTGLNDFQKPYCHSKDELTDWLLNDDKILDLATVVDNVKPSILIGCSTVHGAFTQPIIETMAKHTERPIIMPLSNPSSKSEALPKDLIEWTKGKAIIATGSPFKPVQYNGETFQIAQCNNAYIYPGIGLGVIASKATRVTDAMLHTASMVLSKHAIEISDPHSSLLPSISEYPEFSKHIALAVANQACQDGVSGIEQEYLAEAINNYFWLPEYYDYELLED